MMKQRWNSFYLVNVYLFLSLSLYLKKYKYALF